MFTYRNCCENNFHLGSSVTLKNSEGHTVECTVSKASTMLLGTKSRDERFRKCYTEYQEQGYKILHLNN